MDKYTQELIRLQVQMQNLRNQDRQEEDLAIRTLEDMRSHQEERIQDAKEALGQYENLAAKFRQDLEKEVQTYRTNIVADVEQKLQEILNNEE